MYRNSKSKKMAAEKYKQISGRLHEHFGFKVLTDGNIENVEKVSSREPNTVNKFVCLRSWLLDDI